MTWIVEFTDEFEAWWLTLDEGEQDSVAVTVTILEQRGSMLPFPFSSSVVQSRHNHMRELRIQHKGEPYRVLYAFDPRRAAILLIGGKKAGNERWYDEYVPIADKLYDEHLDTLKREGLI
jgi:hypothetical protein